MENLLDCLRATVGLGVVLPWQGRLHGDEIGRVEANVYRKNPV
jgi:hypothetical protein